MFGLDDGRENVLMLVTYWGNWQMEKCGGTMLPPQNIETRKMVRARPGFEPGTSRTLSENHTPRPTSHTTGSIHARLSRGK